MLRVLAVDDELPALDDLVYLLGRDPRVESVEQASDGGDALRTLGRAMDGGQRLDALFLDVRMPGLDGLDVARVVSRFAAPPTVVFVSAHDDFAVRAFDLRAVDYLLKPVRPERLAEAVRRVAERRAGTDTAGFGPPPGPSAGSPATPGAGAGPSPAGTGFPAPGTAVSPAGRSADGTPAAAAGPGVPPPPAVPYAGDPVIPVESAGVTRFVHRCEVRHVEAHGDYVRLHLPTGSHLLRVPLSTLEEQWGQAGFVRVHRGHLVAVAYIEELLVDAGRLSVRVDGTLLPVSRRSAHRLRELLTRPGHGAVRGAGDA
jgi:DNA-binding LytR/AlgR family response regulator